MKDLKFSLRVLLAQPTFTAVAILTLALGIGATTAIFSIVNSVLLKPLPYNDPEHLYALKSMNPQGLPIGLMAPRFAEPLLKDHPLVEAGALGWALPGSILSSDRTPYPFTPYRVTDGFFNVFTGAIAAGRPFEPGEPQDSIILSNAAWEKYFASDPRIVGSNIIVDNSPRMVVGIARPGFAFPSGAESWQVFRTSPAFEDRINFEAYLRLRPDATPEALQAQLTALTSQLGPNKETGKRFDYVLRPLLQDVVGDLGSTVVLLSGATVILLLIACVNVTNLLLSRSNARTHEIGVREALGAGRFRIIRQLMTETLLLCAIGGTLGFAVAYVSLKVLLGLGPANLPRLGSVGIDGTVLLFSAAAILVTTLLVGIAPSLRLSGRSLRRLVDRGGRGSSAGRLENVVFAALVVAEVGLAVVLVSGAGLLLRSYINLSETDPGVVSNGILWMRMNPASVPLDIQAVPQPDGTVRNAGSGYQPIIDFYRQLMDRISVIPGVTGVTNTQVLPLLRNAADASAEPFTIYGRTDKEETIRIRPLAANFFSTMGVPLVAGRELQDTDRRTTPGVALVNEAFVRQYFPGESPVGKRLVFGLNDFQFPSAGFGFAERLSKDVEIVGVVPDIRFVSMAEPALPNLYMSQDQFTTRLRVLAVRTTLKNPTDLIPTIRKEVAAMAPTVPVEFGLYSDTISASIARERLGMALLAVFAAIALVLAAVGIYGVMAYSVSQRSRELALRAALGAQGSQLLGSVIRRSAVMGFLGVGLGLTGTVALRQIVQSQLYEISALDPLVLLSVPVTLLVIALFASLLPARRASQADPAATLRQ